MDEKLLTQYLHKYIEKIQNGEIYQHVYPETRLVPSNHEEECEENFVDYVIEEISTEIKEILENEFLTNKLKWYNRD